MAKNEDKFEIVCIDTIAHLETLEHDMIVSLIKDLKSNGYFKTNDIVEFNSDGSVCSSRANIDVLFKEIENAHKRFGRILEDSKSKSFGRRRVVNKDYIRGIDR